MLKVGDVAFFKTFDCRIIRGKVLVIIQVGVYLVLGDSVCTTYEDGLYRFSDRNIV